MRIDSHDLRLEQDAVSNCAKQKASRRLERDLDLATLREFLTYHPETGLFTWNINRRRYRAGSIAGTRRGGYVGIWVGGRGGARYFAHRLAFLWMTGKFPEHQVDHIDGDRKNNRWGNLREANQSQNNYNAKLYCTSTTGHKGVYFRRNRFVAAIGIGGRKKKYIGVFKTVEEAAQAYAKALLEISGEFARLK